MRRSLESSRPIFPSQSRDPTLGRSVNRLSTCSTTFSAYGYAPSMSSYRTSSSSGGDPDMRKYSTALGRLDSEKLQEQRYSLSRTQSDDLNKLALGAKVQKAVDRRYYNQDAEMRKKPKVLAPLNEKR